MQHVISKFKVKQVATQLTHTVITWFNNVANWLELNRPLSMVLITIENGWVMTHHMITLINLYITWVIITLSIMVGPTV